MSVHVLAQDGVQLFVYCTWEQGGFQLGRLPFSGPEEQCDVALVRMESKVSHLQVERFGMEKNPTCLHGHLLLSNLIDAASRTVSSGE